MSLSLSDKGLQALSSRNVPKTDYVVLRTIDSASKDENGLVSDSSYRNKIIKVLDPDVADATTDKLIKQGLIIGYKEAGSTIGVI